MNSDRRLAVITGLMFIIATLGSLIATALVSPVLNAPDYLAGITASQSQVLLGAFFEFIGAVACPAIAIALYPVLRRHNEGLALGSVGFRTIEGALYVFIAICFLLLVSLGEDYVSAGSQGSSAFQVLGDQLKAGRAWLGTMGVLTFGIGALMYYLIFYRTRLVPRWLSVWGVVAIVMVMASALLVMFGLIESLSTVQVVLALPIFLQEMVLAVWLIARGFNPSPIDSASDRPRLVPATA